MTPGVGILLLGRLTFSCSRRSGNSALQVAVWGPLWLSGLYVSSLSAALAGLTGSPRVLQAIALGAKLPMLGPLGRSVSCDWLTERGATQINAPCWFCDERSS